MWRVIIVDDDKKVCEGIQKIIINAELNFEVVGMAYNGAEGYEMALETKPDLIITDIYMPKATGIEMIQALREQKVESEVIILSGHSEFKHARDALKLNIREYLSKPTSRKTLIKTLEDIDTHLTNQHNESEHLLNYKNQLKTYTKNATEDLLQNTVKGLINYDNLSATQERIIRNWPQHFYLPIRFNFSVDYEANSKYSNTMLHFGIENIINELSQTLNFKFFYVILDATNFVLLLKYDHETDASSSFDKSINLTANTLGEFFQTNFDYDFGQLAKTWEETIDNIQNLLFNFEYELDSDTFSNFKNELSSAIRQMNIEMVKKSIVEFFTNLKRHNYIYSRGFNIALDMFTILKYELGILNINIYKYLDDDNLLHTLVSFDSWNELQQFFYQLIKKMESEPVFEDNVKHTRLVQDVIEYIDKNIHTRFTLNEIADELYISRNYLGKIFKDKMNITFNEYVTRTRIEKARKKLLTGDYMIYEVAESVGFDNPAYFTAVFKKVTGYSPSKLLQDTKN